MTSPVRYDTAGSHVWTVPAELTNATIVVKGGNGADSNLTRGGYGACLTYTNFKITTSPITFFVGARGQVESTTGGGGGASSMKTTSYILISGGGGGSGGPNMRSLGGNGGDGTIGKGGDGDKFEGNGGGGGGGGGVGGAGGQYITPAGYAGSAGNSGTIIPTSGNSGGAGGGVNTSINATGGIGDGAGGGTRVSLVGGLGAGGGGGGGYGGGGGGCGIEGLGGGSGGGAGGSFVLDSTSVTSSVDTIILGGYVLITWVVLTLDPNGGTPASAKTQTATGVFPIMANTFTKDPHSFEGWALTSNGPVVYYDEDDYDFGAVGASRTLYAVWNTFGATVTFHSNCAIVRSTIQKATGSTPLALNPFVNGNYVFAGWSLTRGQDGAIAYTNGQSYPFVDDEVLWALWGAPSYSLPSPFMASTNFRGMGNIGGY